MTLGELQRYFLLVVVLLGACQSDPGRPSIDQIGHLPEGMEIVATARSTNPAGTDEIDEFYVLVRGDGVDGLMESLKNEGFVEESTPNSTWTQFRGANDRLEVFVGYFDRYKEHRRESPLAQDVLEDLENEMPRGVNANDLVLVLLVELP